MKTVLLVILLLVLPRPSFAQVPVNPWADAASYATAAVNPVRAVVDAWTSEQRWCRLGQFGISEVVGNVAALTLKHFVPSARPCAGCANDGMPSGHTMNSAIGISQGWRVGLALTAGTGMLRVAAHRHTWPQVLAGAGIGIAADYSGRLLRCE